MQDDSTPQDHTDAVIPELNGDLMDNMSARVDFCTLTGVLKDDISARCILSHVYDLVRVQVVLQFVKASIMDGNRSGMVLNCRCALGCLACAFSWQVASGGKEGRWEEKRLLEDVRGR